MYPVKKHSLGHVCVSWSSPLFVTGLAMDVEIVGWDGGFVAALEWLSGPVEMMFHCQFYLTVE